MLPQTLHILISSDKIRDLKKSVVAIGLIKKGNNKPHHIVGTGFTIDKKGIIVTAKHVNDDCKIAQEYYKRVNRIETQKALFRPTHTATNLDFDTAAFREFRHFDMISKHPKFPLSDVDLAFGMLEKPPSDLVEIEVRKPVDEQYSITKEIAMCGFPSGKYTLDMEGEISGMRFSPIFQLGKIAAMLPFDDAPNPYGIQTDIVGTGGSSGSPIIDSEGMVVGIAQAVIPASLHEDAETVYCDTKYVLNKETNSLKEIETKKQSRILGHASVGFVYGITNHILYDLTNAAKQFYQDGEMAEIKLNVTGLDFNYVMNS